MDGSNEVCVGKCMLVMNGEDNDETCEDGKVVGCRKVKSESVACVIHTCASRTHLQKTPQYKNYIIALLQHSK